MKRKRGRISGTGSYIPNKKLSNEDLKKIDPHVKDSDYISTEIGIKSRSIASEHENIAYMGSEAAKKALKAASLKPNDIRYIYVATNSPNFVYPSTAIRIQHAIGAEEAAAYDIIAGCGGFIAALHAANNNAISEDAISLIIGTDAMTATVDYKNAESAGSAMVFGDGAGAAIITPTCEKGILSIFSKSKYVDFIKLETPWDPSKTGPMCQEKQNKQNKREYSFVEMKGLDSFIFSLNVMREAVDKALKIAKKKKEDIKFLFPHQVNIKAMGYIAEYCGKSLEEHIENILADCGSPATASVPISLDIAIKKGRIKPGDLVAIIEYGAGFFYGAAILEL